MNSANKFFSIFSIKIIITTLISIWLLSILVVSLANPYLLGYTNYYDIIIDFFNVLSIIFFLTCIYYIYKFLNSYSPSYYNITALFFSIYIAQGIYNAFFIIKGYPLILTLADHYRDASDSFYDTFHDMGYNRITDDMGIILFNHYLYQHLENEPMLFLPHLVSLPEDQWVSTFAANQDMLKDCILEYNAQKKAAILDSYHTLDSVINSVVERAMSELNINLLERHSTSEWLEVYIRNLQDNPISLNGTIYIVKYDSELGIPFLVDMASFETFNYGFNGMLVADQTLDFWAGYRDMFLRGIIRGVMQKPSLDILSIHGSSFRKAFKVEKTRMEFEEEAKRLNAIDYDIFN